MKSLKIVFASLFLAVGAIAVSSFTVKYDSDAFALVCREYTVDAADNLDPAAADFIVRNNFINTSNWVSSSTSTASCVPTTYLCKICFDDTELSKPGVTLQTIYTALFDQKIEPEQLPEVNGDPFTITIGSQTVTLRVYKHNS